MLKKTPISHPDFEDTKAALVAAEKLAKLVDDKKRKEEEITNLFETYQRTKNCSPAFISHRRRLITSFDVVCPLLKGSFRLSVCSDLLMVSISLSSSGFLDFVKAEGGFTHRFVRWLDLLEIEVEDNFQKKDAITLSLDSSKYITNRPSLTTPATEMLAYSKELGGESLVFQFTNTKAKVEFMKAVDSVTKTHWEEMNSN